MHKGSANFSLSVLDEGNQPTGDLLVNTIGNYKGTTAYGFSAFGNPGMKIQVTADGSWSVQVAPVVPMSAGPSVVIVTADGAWSFSE